MVSLTIDGRLAEVPEGSTILDAIESLGISVPRLCYWKEINKIGACRMCVVEIEGRERLAASCDVLAENGMVIHTNSSRVLETRRINLQLILSQHNANCKECVRSGNCSLQNLMRQIKLKFSEQPYEIKYEHNIIDERSPLIREADKCVKCMRCIQVCERTQTVKVWNVTGTGSRTTVGTIGNVPVSNTICTLCGQCVTHCPVGALIAKDCTGRVADMIADPELIVVALISPAVRIACAEEFGIDNELETPSKLVAAMKNIGFDYVLDSRLGADLMVVEKSAEFIKRFETRKQYQWPMFSTACQSLIRFVKSQFPEFTDNLSTVKTPERSLGAVVKDLFASKRGIDSSKIRVVSIAPCLSKKYKRGVVQDNILSLDVDATLMVREFARFLKLKTWQHQNLQPMEFDSLIEKDVTSGSLPEVSGGTSRAVLRSIYYQVTGKNAPDATIQTNIDGRPWDEMSIVVPNYAEIKAAVVSGLGNVRHLIDDLKKGKVEYDFVEVMACPHGCVEGGGQPIHEAEAHDKFLDHLLSRFEQLPQTYSSDENVKSLYEESLGKPNEEKAIRLLHTNHHSWQMPNAIRR